MQRENNGTVECTWLSGVLLRVASMRYKCLHPVHLTHISVKRIEPRTKDLGVVGVIRVVADGQETKVAHWRRFQFNHILTVLLL